jgi:hypothetical protein
MGTRVARLRAIDAAMHVTRAPLPLIDAAIRATRAPIPLVDVPHSAFTFRIPRFTIDDARSDTVDGFSFRLIVFL